MALAWSELLGREVRDEPWSELTESTYARVRDAITARQFRSAADYLVYFHDEALICKRLFDQWLTDTFKYLRFKGMGEGEISALVARLTRLIAPDGAAQGPWDRDEGWEDYVAIKDELLGRLQDEQGVEPADRLIGRLAAAKEAWRLSHDLDVDLLLGLFDAVIERFGEAAIGEMWEEHLVRDWFEKRYQRFDVSKNPWEECHRLLTFLSFEAMHGHLCGPGREGDVEFEEFEDRVELRFDPCGSGGRAHRGEPIEGTPSRFGPPYNFRVLEEAHDFTWNKKGICTYCAHCCVLTERLPAKMFGYPVRVIDPPSYPRDVDAKCRYTIYKDPRAIPAQVYERIGLTKPAPDQPLGSAHGPFLKDPAPVKP